MKGQKIFLEGTITKSRNGDEDGQKIVSGKFEIGNNSNCQIITGEGGKKFLLVTNMPDEMIIF